MIYLIILFSAFKSQIKANNELNENNDSSTSKINTSELEERRKKAKTQQAQKIKKINYNKLYNDYKDKICQKKQPRKYHFDSMLKKLKSKTFKAIHTCIRACIKENIILKRIPQSFITDIKIDSNKKTFEKSIKEIYEDFDIIFNLTEEEVKFGKLENLEKFLSTKFSDIYKFYVSSKQFIRDKNDLIKKHNENFGTLFELMSEYYINYFHASKGNKIKRRRNLRKINFKVITSEQLEKLKSN